MSRGHGASRRRNYGRRQSEVRHRNDQDLAIDLQGPAAWPRGRGWESAGDGRGGRGDAGISQSNQAAG